ncbi:STM4015 family protein [Bradyrhizobium sp. HKCCYLS20291]|uniref:STM4015 family protein n=1 Tax=Bradyrhizobium sp. HKCCYLS20291 TaxID=3420766 RepID=UPI003EBB50CA
MSIEANLWTFHGRDVVDFEPGGSLPDPTQSAIRLALRVEGPFSTFSDLWGEFMSTEGVENTEALVIGIWGDPEEGMPGSSDQAVPIIVADADRLSRLRALFFGDISSEESEISWIEQSDVSAFWGAFPALEEFGIRGGQSLQLGRIKHDRLRILKVETGGLSGAVVREIASAELPELEHLEIWLGSEGYGGDSTPADLIPILSGNRFPKLVTLALRNCEWADDLAAIVAQAPILSRIKRLDLSLGTLGDDGVDYLVASPAIRGLEHLNIAHHFVSEAGLTKLAALGIPVNTDDRQKQDSDGDRYVAVAE